jgi:membrane dipeptidase
MQQRNTQEIVRGSLAALLTLTMTACAPAPPKEGGAPEEEPAMDLQAKAERLAQDLLIVDTHVDVPYRLEEKMEDISQRTESGDFDFPRAQAGGLNAPFMSIYVPASYQDPDPEGPGAKAFADSLIDMVEGFAEQWPDKFAIATSPEDLAVHKAEGKISLPLGIENGAPVEDDLANLAHFHQRGIRYITLTHSENNQICDSSYAPSRQWNGLSPFGREVVVEMNRLGIMVDISHVSDDAFYQVIEITKAPVIASHSSARHFTPDFERNMDDAMIRKLAENGGVIQINFGSAFLLGEAREQSMAFWAAVGAYAEEHGLERGSPELETFQEEYWAEREKIFADVTDVADHIDHVVQLVGIDHVGIGSDFDGVGDSLPTGLKDASHFPNLIRVLLERGYSEGDIEKILSGNILRVWRQVEAVAAELQGAG